MQLQPLTSSKIRFESQRIQIQHCKLILARNRKRVSILVSSNNNLQNETQTTPSTNGTTPTTEADFWEGEQWESFGKIASFTLPVLAVLAVGVGLFAAQTYNQDATVFLESPKSADDTAKLFTYSPQE